MMQSCKALSIVSLMLFFNNCQSPQRQVQDIKPRPPAASVGDDSSILLPDMFKPADKKKAAMSLEQMYASLPEYEGEYSSEESLSWLDNLSAMRGIICSDGKTAKLEMLPSLEQNVKAAANSSDEKFLQSLTEIAGHVKAIDPDLSRRLTIFVRDFEKQTLFSEFPLTNLIFKIDLESLVLKPHQNNCRIALGALNQPILVSGTKYERYIWYSLWQQLNPAEKVQWALTWITNEQKLIRGYPNDSSMAEPLLSYISKLQSLSFSDSAWLEYAASIKAIGGVYRYPYEDIWLDGTWIKKDEQGLISGWIIHASSPPMIKLGNIYFENSKASDIIVSLSGGKIKTISSNALAVIFISGNCKIATRVGGRWTQLTLLDDLYQQFILEGSMDLGPCLASTGLIHAVNPDEIVAKSLKKDTQKISFGTMRGVATNAAKFKQDMGWTCKSSDCKIYIKSLYPDLKHREIYIAGEEISTSDGKVYSNGDFYISYDAHGKITKILGGVEYDIEY